MKANHRRGHREAENTLTQRTQVKGICPTSKNRLKNGSHIFLGQAKLAPAKRENKEKMQRWRRRIMTTGAPNLRRISASTTLPGLKFKPGSSMEEKDHP
jgi:hypothetical protein